MTTALTFNERSCKAQLKDTLNALAKLTNINNWPRAKRARRGTIQPRLR